MTEIKSRLKNFHLKYSWVYPIILGFIFVIIVGLLGMQWFGDDETIFTGNKLAYLTNLWTEAVSIAITVFILDQINRYRERLTSERKEEEQKLEAIANKKKDLLIELTSDDKVTSRIALNKIRAEGWLQDGTFKKMNLSKVNLQGADLQGIDLQEANLSEANLDGANLQGANLQGVDLRETNLNGANLDKANLDAATLDGANMKKTTLRWASLREAKLRVADLGEANLRGVNLEGANLDEANLRDTILEDMKINFSEFRKKLDGSKPAGEALREVKLARIKLETVEFRLTRDLIFFNSKMQPISIKLNENTILPDSTKWTDDTDMTRYTNPNHDDFWQATWFE